MNPQDSQSELRETLKDFTYNLKVDTPDGFESKTVVDLEEALYQFEAYVTTRVKEADEKAHLIGFKNGKRAAIKRMNDLWTTIMVDEVGSEKAFAYKEAIEAALTTTTNGKEK